MSFWQKLLGFIFPEKCVGCGKKDETLCILCIQKIRAPQDNLPPRYHALYSFKDPTVKRALWELKYKNRKPLADILGTLLGEHLFSEVTEEALFSPEHTPPLIIPIPLHQKKKRERGYNQSELIARAALASAPTLNGKQLGEVHADILHKIRDTLPQAKIKNRAERLRNLHGAFSVKNLELLHRRTVILIDDVTTTGATLNEARRVLLDAGARKVIGYTVAH